MIRRIVLLLAIAATLLALPGCPKTEPPKNLVIVTLDTTRADHTGLYGCERPTTPNLDRLAKRSAVFTGAVTPLPVTDPAHMSLMTGRRPYRIGVEENGFELDAAEVTLAEVLKGRGYATAAFVSVRHLGTSGFSQGFSTYVRPTDVHQIKADVTTDRALAWLETAPEPFFLWVHLFDPHMDYNAPEPFKRMFGDDPVARYDGEIAYADSKLGELLHAIDARRLTDRTAIVVASDHGENLLDVPSAPGKPDYRYHHGHTVEEFEIHTVLTMHLPGLATNGSAVDGAAELDDVFPTVLDYLATDPPAGVTLDGVSLLPAIGGTGSPRRFAHSYTNWNRAPWMAVRTPAAKLVRDIRDGSDRLVRLDGAGDVPPDAAAELKAEMDRWEAAKHAVVEARKRPRATIDPAIIENLKALGYVDEPLPPEPDVTGPK